MKRSFNITVLACIGYSILYTVFMYILHFYRENIKILDFIVLLAGFLTSIIYLGLVYKRKVENHEVLTIITFHLSTISVVWFLIHSIFEFWNPLKIYEFRWISIILGSIFSLFNLWCLYSLRNMDKELSEWENRLN